MPIASYAARRRLLLAAVAVALVGGIAAAWFLWPGPKPTPQVTRLADGTEAFYLSDSRIEAAAGYPQPRELRVDGEFFLTIPAQAQNLIVRTRLLVLTVSGETAMRIVAHSKEAGEQVEVLYGNVEARKSYPSQYSEPDQLAAGGMVLINRDIDLMEKETCDVGQLKSWSDAWVAAARAEMAKRQSDRPPTG